MILYISIVVDLYFIIVVDKFSHPVSIRWYCVKYFLCMLFFLWTSLQQKIRYAKLLFFFISVSVQESLERKFGKQGGPIPIVPTADFQARVAVSI